MKLITSHPNLDRKLHKAALAATVLIMRRLLTIENKTPLTSTRVAVNVFLVSILDGAEEETISIYTFMPDEKSEEVKITVTTESPQSFRSIEWTNIIHTPTWCADISKIKIPATEKIRPLNDIRWWHCTGEAHKPNADYDHCMVCNPNWEWVPTCTECDGRLTQKQTIDKSVEPFRWLSTYVCKKCKIKWVENA